MQGKKEKKPAGYRELRLATIAIGLVVFFVLASVAFSVYADYRSLTNTANGQGHAVTVQRFLNGQVETVKVNATISNGGIYALNVTLSCPDAVPVGVTCTKGSVFVGPGSSAVLHFTFRIANVSEWAGSGSTRINGTLRGELVPLSSISVEFDLASLLSKAGA